jgi:hypothetical protein
MHTDTIATAVRSATGKVGEAKSHLVKITYPDGTTSEHGGKIAARATHAVIGYSRPAREGDDAWYIANRADTWGVLALAGRVDLAQKRYNEMQSRWARRGDRVALVAITDEGQ